MPLLEAADVRFLRLEHLVRDDFGHGFSKLWMVRRAADGAGLALLEMLGQQHGAGLLGQFAQMRELRAGRLPLRLCLLGSLLRLLIASRGFSDEGLAPGGGRRLFLLRQEILLAEFQRVNIERFLLQGFGLLLLCLEVLFRRQEPLLGRGGLLLTFLTSGLFG